MRYQFVPDHWTTIEHDGEVIVVLTVFPDGYEHKVEFFLEEMRFLTSTIPTTDEAIVNGPIVERIRANVLRQVRRYYTNPQPSQMGYITGMREDKE